MPAQEWEECRTEFNRREWAQAYQNTEEFPDGFTLPCEGCLPCELEGTYYRNGPGLFKHGQDVVTHPFDGHGLLASVSFSGGNAFFRSRFVDTKEYRDETSAGQVIYPGTFGTKPAGGFFHNFLGSLSLRNPANTGILAWAGKHLALFEAGQPYRWDPETLETQGVDLLGGVAQRGAPFSSGSRIVDAIASWFLRMLGVGNNMDGGFRLGGHAVSAHPVEDTANKCLVVFTYRLQLGFVPMQLILLNYLITLRLPGLLTKLRIHEFDEEFKQQSVVEHDLPGYAFLHDISLSPLHYVIFCNPVRLRMLPLILGLQSPAHCIEWTHQPAKILAFRRPRSGHAQIKSAESRSPSFIRRDSAIELSHCLFTSKGVAEEHMEDVKQETSSCTTIACPSPGFVFHQSNAYCADKNTLIVDCIRYPTMPDFKQGSEEGETFMDCVVPDLQPVSQLYRYTADLGTGKCSELLLANRAMEFPAIHPGYTGRKHRYIYTAAALHPTANRPQQALCKLDLETGISKLWSRGEKCYCGEPIFVPSPSGSLEDDGWILSINYNAEQEKSECSVLSASTFELLAILDLRHILPHGLHGAWQPPC